ncbi:MAG: biotin/lipoate A/B protein ligase family protein [Thermodesulfobacteriota bacterium]
MSSFETWRLLTYTTRDPYENMALDETLLLACNKGLSPPTLRFYTWDPPAVSIGYAQNPCKEINIIELCKRSGMPLIRRITGGRAILHHNRDLTYALVLRGERGPKKVSVTESYKMVNICLVNALQSIGIKAGLRFRKEVVLKEKSSFCFRTPANNDIIISGKKVVGSAQRRLERAFMQHGSIILFPPPDDLIKVFKGLSAGSDDSFTWLNRHTTKAIDIVELHKTILKGFEKGMKIRFFKDGLMEHEVKLKERLLKEKYLKDEWNLSRSVSKRVAPGITRRQ